MNSQDFRNLQEAYLDVYQEIDEATAMSKRGYDEVPIRNEIANKTVRANTRDGRTVDKATALADRNTYGDKKKKEGREKHARAQRHTFHDTNSSSPGLHGYPYNPNNKPSESDPNSPERVRELQGARGKQRARVGLTPNERKLYTSYEYDLYDVILEYLISEGYADTVENALVIMGNMSEDWRESIVEAQEPRNLKDEELRRRPKPRNLKDEELRRRPKPRNLKDEELRRRYKHYGEAFVDPENDTLPSGQTPLQKVSGHPNPSVRKKAVRGMIIQMEKEYGGKFKAKSKDPTKDD